MKKPTSSQRIDGKTKNNHQGPHPGGSMGWKPFLYLDDLWPGHTFSTQNREAVLDSEQKKPVFKQANQIERAGQPRNIYKKTFWHETQKTGSIYIL